MKFHILAGDALAKDFNKTNIEGEVIVCRECLIEGDVSAGSLEDFWNVRANFHGKTYGEDTKSYYEQVFTEFEKLQNIPEGSEVNLWFEYELFCQINLWFCLSLVSDKKVESYRVAPVVRNENEIWKGFGRLGSDELETCFEQRIKLNKADVELGKQLWDAFCLRDNRKLISLSETVSKAFPKLKEVCLAATEIKARPKERLQQIVSSGETDFNKIFSQFVRTEGVYGFGDAQVKRILQEI